MKKWTAITPLFYGSIVIGFLVIALVLIAFLQYDIEIETGNAQMQLIEFKEKINVEIMSRNYIENTEFLLRAEIDGEQVGIVYFDEDGNIRFDGNKEKFEYALYTAFKLRGYGKEIEQ